MTVTGPKEAEARMQATRYPDLSRLPIYPGADDIERASKTLDGGNEESTVNYVVQLKPDDVNKWYQETMKSYKWWDEKTTADTPTGGAYFVYETAASPSGHKTTDMTIVPTIRDDGKTKVDVRAIEYRTP
jgi:hypothetical protein